MPTSAAGRDLDRRERRGSRRSEDKRIAVIGIDGVTANEEARADGATVYLSELGNRSTPARRPGWPAPIPTALERGAGRYRFPVSQYDIVIPYFHLGVEYSAFPRNGRSRAPAPRSTSGRRWWSPTIRMSSRAWSSTAVSRSSIRSATSSSTRCCRRCPAGDDSRDRDCAATVSSGLRYKGVEIEDFNQPRLMSAGEHASQMDRFWAATDRLANGG